MQGAVVHEGAVVPGQVPEVFNADDGVDTVLILGELQLPAIDAAKLAR